MKKGTELNIKKNMWLYITVVGAIAAAVGSFMLTKQSGEQTDRIEGLTKETKQQTDKIKLQQDLIELLQRETKTEVIKTKQNTEELKGEQTGGDSYPKFSYAFRGDPRQGDEYKGVQFSVKNIGDFPLKDLKMRVVDIEDFNKKSSACFHHHATTLDLKCSPVFINLNTVSGTPKFKQPGLIEIDGQDIGDVKAKGNIILFELWFNKKLPAQGYNIYIESSHICWIYEFRAQFEEEFNYAYRLRKIGNKREGWELIEIGSSDEYPMDKQGSPIFYDK